MSALEKFERSTGSCWRWRREGTILVQTPSSRTIGFPFPFPSASSKGVTGPRPFRTGFGSREGTGFGREKSIEEAKEEFRGALVGLEAADPWFRDHPPELEWWGGRFHPAKVSDEIPSFWRLEGAFEALGMEAGGLKGVTFGSDMRLLVREGATPTVLFGPGDIRQAHAADESVSVESYRMQQGFWR